MKCLPLALLLAVVHAQAGDVAIYTAGPRGERCVQYGSLDRDGSVTTLGVPLICGPAPAASRPAAAKAPRPARAASFTYLDYSPTGK